MDPALNHFSRQLDARAEFEDLGHEPRSQGSTMPETKKAAHVCLQPGAHALIEMQGMP